MVSDFVQLDSISVRRSERRAGFLYKVLPSHVEVIYQDDILLPVAVTGDIDRKSRLPVFHICRHLDSRSKESQYECRKAYNGYVNDIVTNDNSKKLYSFIKGKKCESSGIAPLKKDGIAHSDPRIKATILNNQFSSVFSEENPTNLPSMGEACSLTCTPLLSTKRECGSYCMG